MNNLPLNKKIVYKLIWIALTVLLIIVSTEIFAQFGGGGGSSGSNSSGGDGIAELIFYLLLMLPFPINIIAIAILILGLLLYAKLKKQASILNKIPSSKIPRNPNYRDIKQYSALNPTFNEIDFLKKTEKAFFDLQTAWSDKNINRARRYISDGMYQRVNTQFKMMDILDQTNPLEKLTLNKLVIEKIDFDGYFDVIDVSVFAQIKNKYVSNKYPNLNIPIYEEFVEYWTFIRKSNHKGSYDLYNSENCPNCGSHLPQNMSDICKCSFCGTITNSGEYDWILTEITQADDYVSTNYLHDLSDNLANKIENILDQDDNFSKQIIEDKVSNGFLQIETARVYKNPLIMKRFVSDEYFNRLGLEIETGPAYIYNRIFINDATLIGALQKDGKNILAVYLRSSFQRVKIRNGSAYFLDQSVMSKQEIVLVARNIDFLQNKGSLYAYQCSACGGSLLDTTNMNCPFCGTIINSFKHEWIITDIMPKNTYLEYYKENSAYYIANINNKKLDSRMKLRDYAFNNIMVMIAADGKFEEDEIVFANKMAKKYGYSPSKLNGMLDLAKNNKLIIKMPENMSDRHKIYKLMKKAAAADGHICTAEHKLLQDIQDEYLR